MRFPFALYKQSLKALLENLCPVRAYKISGHSMEPGIKSGAVVLVVKWFGSLKIGDIVMAKRGKDLLVKRILLTKGDEYFLEGDNKSDSLDSRKLGYFQRREIIGKVVKVFS